MNLDTQNLPPEVAAYIRSLEQEKQRLEQRKQQTAGAGETATGKTAGEVAVSE